MRRHTGVFASIWDRTVPKATEPDCHDARCPTIVSGVVSTDATLQWPDAPPPQQSEKPVLVPATRHWLHRVAAS